MVSNLQFWIIFTGLSMNHFSLFAITSFVISIALFIFSQWSRASLNFRNCISFNISITSDIVTNYLYFSGMKMVEKEQQNRII